MGHYAPACTQALGGRMTCFSCGRMGHMAKDCTEMIPANAERDPAGQRPLPPPPKRQEVFPRVHVLGEHEELEQ
ncbi:unnamed protein product [Arabis nemorensis]|uniref:CCHC-type domain-containing protein n=1 Tax=Arabis nemorensis TaxID=586526 RepID=A0A565AZ85_9BRAS|nr:unnamed protein product [Arabis nemorensis]